MSRPLAAPSRPPRAARLPARAAALAPGLGLVAALALGAMAAQRLSGIGALSPMVLALVAGIALRNLGGVPAAAAPGLALAMRTLLRLGIVLLGFRLTLGDLAQVGAPGLAAIAATLGLTFVFTKAAGRALGVDRRLAELIAAGTAVCGASAVMAVNAVARGRDEDVAFAIACVTVFGTLSMLLFPLLAGPLGLAAPDYGLWVGASVHEVAQAAGAGFALGDAAGQSATVAKLARVMLLAPLVLSLAALRRAEPGAARPPAPWFVLGFVAAAALNSAVSLPPAASAALAETAAVLLTTALAAMGCEIDLARLRAVGLRPLALGALAWAFVSGLALLLVLAL
ncbi:YeiH family protein [Albimonas pacifica]|uniref:Conserved hypothetical integral membrane protein n=1 Tax=Albimonas pacifica TaxID=1114924 RepID=A0A1I3LPW9_9RHOB|nr:putative sulfate exporter family transporter [Albimonas pacifica]SFI86809.1 conserved hypothetical integral membrane protein [Albimonas pacifica]